MTPSAYPTNPATAVIEERTVIVPTPTGRRTVVVGRITWHGAAGAASCGEWRPLPNQITLARECQAQQVLTVEGQPYA